ncbi:Uroporphyrinogen-III methyltransferase [hydrothermal vent metagenome]|uniref:uroporphyrinogen-III C-methyltransferase n=1 Tax=hydrothermal vent metagenome TaxID=652676 RepID=A0A3B0XYE7_9ZZZZ
MSNQACVYLVGTGPGDADLLTLKALRLMQSADVIVYDRLVSQQVLNLIPSGIAQIYVGKASGHHSLKQTEINQLLVRCAEKNRRVVRLKGGDPFVFGRGSEEALYLVQHGICFEVVPGITAASAVSSYAGIPLTHRGLSRGVKIITGHAQENRPLDINWKKLADKDHTIVVYMGLENIRQISQQLIIHGLAAETPVAAIENGAGEKQRRIISTLSKIADSVKKQRVQAPVLFVMGEVVRLADQLDWYSGIKMEAENIPQNKPGKKYAHL